MARFNEILAGRFNRFAQKHFSMKGRQGTPTLAADLQLDMSLNNGAENRYLEGWDLFGITIQSNGPIAAQINVLSFRNPVGSGVVAVFTKIYAVDQTAGTSAVNAGLVFVVRGMTTDQNTVPGNAPQGWDIRGRANPSIIVTKNSAAPAATGGTAVNISSSAVAANTGYDHLLPPNEIPILPGSGITIQSSAVNTTSSATVWWRERALEDSEKT